MGKYLQPVKTSGTRAFPVFQKVLETARGGFSLKTTGLKEGDILPAGTAIAFDEKTRIATKAKADGTDVKGLLYDDVVVVANAPVSIVVRGTCYVHRIPVDANVDAIKAKLPLIIFSESF